MGNKIECNYEISNIGRIVEDTKAKARIMVKQATQAKEIMYAIIPVVEKFDGKMYNVRFKEAFQAVVRPMIANVNVNCYIDTKYNYKVDPTPVVHAIVSSFRGYENIPYERWNGEMDTRSVSLDCFYPFSFLLYKDHAKRIDASWVKEEIAQEVVRMDKYIDDGNAILAMSNEGIVAIVLEINRMNKEFALLIDGLSPLLKEAIDN